MQVYTGQVRSTSDPTRRGLLKVFCKDLDFEFEVYYTTSYHAVNEGGVFSPPVIGSYILFTGDLEKNEFYYLSTIVGKLANQMHPDDAGDRPKDFQEIKEVDKIYGKATIPQQLRFTDHRGNGLVVSNKHLKETKRVDLRTQLQSARGKVIALNDSPHANMINIETAHGDGIFISQGKKNKAYGYRSLHIKSKNSVNIRSDSLGINMTVVEGAEFNIKNLSTTKNGSASLRQKRKLGNVNIVSKYRDVNIWTDGDNGAIFIRTPNARIQIEPSGRIYLSGETLEVRVNGDFNVNAQGSINLDSNGKIRLKSNSDVSIAGSKIDLNNPTDLSQPAPTIAEPLTSGYELP